MKLRCRSSFANQEDTRSCTTQTLSCSTTGFGFALVYMYDMSYAVYSIKLKHFKIRPLFSRWGANFNATASTRDNSKRGWTIDMKKLPRDLLIPFCEQVCLAKSNL